MNVKIGAASLNQTPFDFENNMANIKRAIQQAQEEDISVLCLPELCITGYGCEDGFFYRDFVDEALMYAKELTYCVESGFCFTVGLPMFLGDSLYNCIALISDRKILGFVPKSNLARDGVHYENRWFYGWQRGKVVNYEPINMPFGDLVFDLGDLRVGFEICEDAWVPNRTARDLCVRGADLILNPSASHFSFGKHETRRRFVEDGSRAFSCVYVYANLLGNEAGRIIYDGDCLIASNGNILAESKRFSFKDTEVISACIDIDMIRSERTQREGFERDHIYEEETVLNLKMDLTTNSKSSNKIECAKLSKEEEFTRAVCLGLFDYMRKSKVKGYVVSLSGGADSATAACLVYLMKVLAQNEIGDGARAKLGLTEDEWNSILRCYYVASKNSSSVTRKAAEEIALAIGANYDLIDVSDIIENYEDKAEKVVGKILYWETDDIVMQNIQARSRSPMVWMMANYYNCILLSTSNRSEAAVGYATMDGDTSGGLNPIGGIDKDFINRWLKWLEKDGGKIVDPIEEVKFITRQEPTAELRPIEHDEQTDEKDLMPYDVLNEIENLAIGKKFGPRKVLKIMMDSDFSSVYKKERMIEWIKKFYRMWCMNQWKRERYAPCFHLDDRNLDPKTWCRFPILNSGFRKELESL